MTTYPERPHPRRVRARARPPRGGVSRFAGDAARTSSTRAAPRRHPADARGATRCASSPVEAYRRFIHGETWITGGGAPRRWRPQVIGWMGGLLRCADAPAGFISAGGSESNMCAILTAKQLRAGVGGSVVFPDNGHYSLHKLCRMFDLDAIVVPAPEGHLDRVDPAAIEAAIRPDTIAIIATAGTRGRSAASTRSPRSARSRSAHGIYLHVGRRVRRVHPAVPRALGVRHRDPALGLPGARRLRPSAPTCTRTGWRRRPRAA